MRVAILDADTLLWTAAYLNREKEDSAEMLSNLDSFLNKILTDTVATHYVGFLKGCTSFRSVMFPDYKAQRPPNPDWLLKWKPVLEKHLTGAYGKWKFQFTTNGFEADDAVASVAYSLNLQGIEHVVCSPDKDLRQIPGINYNYKKGEFLLIDDKEAMRTLQLQFLTGDVTDNIPNVEKGIGPAKAAKILDDKLFNSAGGLHNVYNAFVKANKDEFKGIIKLAENVLKCTLRRDETYPYTICSVPIKEDITELFNGTN
jgi:5'-3' exonuclease